MGTGIMVLLLLHVLTVTWILGCVAGDAHAPCCTQKTVGGVSYILVKEGDTSNYNCLTNCMYTKETGGPLYCFAAGDLEVECGDSTVTTEISGGPTAPVPSGNTSCTYPPDHTMNTYPGPAPVCGDTLIYSGLTTAAKEQLLHTHNLLGQKVASGGETGQPGGSNMRKLDWSEELARVAQRWADQCKGGHDTARDMCDGTMVGQNVAAFWNSVEDSVDTVLGTMDTTTKYWYDEVTNPGFDSANINPFVFDYGSGHYTQVVWADTTMVGCGLTYYLEAGWYTTLVVCNYAVAGNLEGVPMYQLGAPCTTCPSGTSCDTQYDALCAA